MATDLKPQTRTAPAAKHEQFVEQQLARARRRIRKLDAVGSVLILLTGLLGYALVIAALDRAFDLPEAARVVALCVAGAAALAYLGLSVFRHIQWHVNPYYAARRLEQTIPDAKNSLINWLDLRDQPMPGVIRGTLGRKAAADLNEADLEHAVSASRLWWLAAVAGALALALFIWLMTGPGQLTSLLRRAFFPFGKAAIATRTDITVVAPRGGDVVLPKRQDVQIRVQVSGRVPRVNDPDALRVHYRYRQEDPFIVRPLDRDDDGQWFRTVVADEVNDGFWYKVSGGDTETPVYQVKVRAQPHVSRFDVKFDYRPYLCRKPLEVRCGPSESRPRPDLKELRGTEVTLVARTNRTWRSGHLVLQEGPAVRKLPGEEVANDPQARSFRFVMDRDGTFAVHFVSTEDEPNVDRRPYKIEVIKDREPVVKLVKPGRNVTLPANGTLPLEGFAQDDFGVKSMTLRLRVKKGAPAAQVKEGTPQPDLAPQPYRPGVSFKLANGTYPTGLYYKDFVALEKVKTARGQPFPLVAGMVLEYWLEAVDNCDYPDAGGNVGKSQAYLVTITEPDRDKQRQKQRQDQAEKEQARHNQEQNRDQERRNQEAQQDQAGGQDTPEAEKRRKDFENEAEKVKQKLDQLQKEKENKGGSKGDGSPDGTGEKGPNKSGAGDGKQPDQKDPGEGKGPDKKGPKEKGPDKDGPKGGKPEEKEGDGQSQAGSGKGQGEKDPKAGPPGEAKDKMDDGVGKGGAGKPEQAKTPPKEGPQGKEGDGGSKGAEAGKGPPQTGGSKGPGKPQQGKPTPKGKQPPAGQGASKAPGAPPDGPDAQPAGNSKGGDPKGKKAGKAAQGKTAPPQQAERAGAGKADRQPDEAGEKGRTPEEATMEDIAKLKERLQRPEQEGESLDDLNRVRKEARDPEVRKAARDLLEKYGRDVLDSESADAKRGEKKDAKAVKSKKKGRGTPDQKQKGKQDTGDVKGKGPPEGEAVGKGKDGGETTPKQVDEKGQSKKGGRVGDPRGGFSNTPEDGKPNPVDEAAARRAGELQLEKLRDRLKDPRFLEKMDWTPKDADRFLEQARAYQEWLRQQGKLAGTDKETARGDRSVLKSVGPYRVGERRNATRDPLETGQAQPPPEFREAQRRFTATPRD
jgi:collagen type III alpha